MGWKPNNSSSRSRLWGGVDLRAVIDRFIDISQIVWAVILFPFRLLQIIVGAAAELARQLIRVAIQLFFALFGLAFVSFVGFGLIRVIFHPLFV